MLLAVVGCTGSLTTTVVPTAPPTVALHVSNGTTLTVTLVVNGEPEGVFPPGELGPRLDAASLPALPWTVEAKSPSGRVLTTMTVSVSEATQSDPNMHLIPMGRVDLSCGRLTIFAGDFPPSGPVPPSPAGSPGDCAP
jgi:hypothetical protein